jgi:hypothetical protein
VYYFTCFLIIVIIIIIFSQNYVADPNPTKIFSPILQFLFLDAPNEAEADLLVSSGIDHTDGKIIVATIEINHHKMIKGLR